MGEVVVTGKTNDAGGSTSTTTITAADIREAGHRTLDKALRLVPGLYIHTGGAGTPRIDVRGLRTRQ
ncbi:MAG: Plug domain-containing protein, partial [Desulfobacteraceae bacterium]|nr:Plug domain-containing protein [Desulfobacteraceae bacterium]